MTPTQFDHRYRYVGFWVLAALVLVLAFQILLPFLPGIIGGVILSVLTYPIYSRLLKRMRDIWASLATVLITLVCFAIPMTLVGVMVSLQLRTLVGELEKDSSGHRTTLSQDVLLKRGDEILAPLATQAGSDFKLTTWYEENKQQITQGTTRTLTQLGGRTVIGIALFGLSFLCMFFMLKDGKKLLEPALDLLPLSRDDGLKLLTRLRDTVIAVFMGVVLVAFIQGTLATVAYALAGVNAWLLWGAATVVCAAIPVLGAPVIYIPLTLLLLAQGRTVPALVMLGFCALIVSNIDNFLRPKYIGERVGLHYMVVFFSLLGGILYFGPVGLIFGPCVASAVLCLGEVVREMRRQGTPDPA